MKKRHVLGVLGLAALLAAQDRLVIEITKEEERPAIAVPDFRGTGDAAVQYLRDGASFGGFRVLRECKRAGSE